MRRYVRVFGMDVVIDPSDRVEEGQLNISSAEDYHRWGFRGSWHLKASNAAGYQNVKVGVTEQKGERGCQSINSAGL